MKKSDFHSGRRFLLSFVTTYSVFLVIIFTMGLVLYKNGINDAKSRLYQLNQNSLDKAVQELDSSLMLMSTLSSQSLSNKSIKDLVLRENTDDNFYQLCLSGMKLLSSQISIKSILPINDSYIFLPITNYMLYSSSLSNAELYYKHTKNYNMDLYQEWITMMNSYDNTFTFIPLSYYKSKTETSLLYRVPLSDFSLFQKYPGFVCYEIDYNKLSDIFAAVGLFENGFLYVTNSAGCVQFQLTDSAKAVFSPDELNIPFEKSVNYIEIEHNNEKMLLTYTSSPNNQWKYYLVQPSELVFGQLITYEKANSFIILSACIISFILVLLLSRQGIRPIIQINTQLEKSLDKQLSLQEALERQRPIIYNTYLSKIMKGLLYSKDELEDIAEFLKITALGNKYSVLYCSIYMNESELFLAELNKEEAMISEIASYRELINHYLFEYFGTDILIYEPEFNSFALLLISPAEQEFDSFVNNIQTIFFNLHENLIEEHSLWIYGGLGNRNSDLAYVWKSYQQAMEASAYIHDGGFFQCYNTIKRDLSSYYYPIELAQQLTNFIISNNKKQVREIFKILNRENFENHTPPVNVVRWLVSDIRNTLLKVRFNISQDKTNKELLDDIDNNLQNYKSVELMEEISLKLCDMFEQKVESNKIIQSIKQYISENYSDSSLSLKKISEEFSISESYFSYLFKAEYKQNFSEYLEHLRMEKAMHLLVSSDINVSDLYVETGYNNANSFRRAFKKIHGVSPKAIRELNSQK